MGFHHPEPKKDSAMAYAIDPELRPIAEMVPDTSFEDYQTARSMIEELIALAAPTIDESDLLIDECQIPGHDGGPAVRIRIYRPARREAVTPGLIYIHGGGFVVGSLDSEHGMVVSLCRDLGILIVSVGYRLAPENPFPAGLDDCYAALCWTATNADTLKVDRNRIGVIGQSAGGGLSAALALMTRDRQGPKLRFQFLGIPELDDRLETHSMKMFTDTPLWNRPNAILSWKYYLGDRFAPGSNNVPYLAAPARAEDLSGLPPAHVTTMEFDPLRDEGIEYALRLLRAGVSVELHSYPGTFHGSTLVTNAAVSKREQEEMRVALRRGLSIDAHA
jgi:acetyl esterase/lipase